MDINESNYIDELKNKNNNALSFVTITYGNLIFKISYKYLNSKEASEECLNDVLLKIWINIEDFTYDNSKFKNWICSIAKNTAIDMIRKNSKTTNTISDENLEIPDEKNIEDIVLNKEELRCVKNLIYKLKDIDREIIINRFFLDKSLKEISKDLNINTKTLYSRIAKIRKSLYQSLLEEENVHEQV